MRAALMIAAALVAALAAGCGGDARDDVEAYIRDVNTLQQELLISLTQASAAYRGFTTDERELAKLRPKLVQAERSLRRLERRPANLQPPSEARRLHELVRDLIVAQVRLADELERTSAYLPAFTAAVQPLEAGERRLREELGSARATPAQAKAIRQFERVLATVLEQLAQLDPPPVVSAAHETETAALTRLRESAVELAATLEKPDWPADLPRLVQRFLNAPLSVQSLAAQRRRIDAVKAYNARVERIGELAQSVERERLRLQESLG